jgi:hypothetical protein
MCWKRKLQLQHGSEEGKLGGVRNPLVETQAERDALNKVKLNKFAVVPAMVSPYGTVTASWDATVPNTGFEIALKLNGQVVANTGSKTFTVSQRTEFTLAAVIDDPPEPLAARILRTLQVIVNTSDCQNEGLPSSAMTVPLKEAMDGAFSGAGSFTLKPGGSVVTAGADGLADIHVPITINVPDWFDADMDIHLQLTISGADGHVFVAAPVVDPQVQWSLLSNLASLGCTDAIGQGMTKISQAFLERIVDEEIRPAVTQKIEDQVNTFLTTLHNNDAQKRTFTMTSLIFAANEGLLITGCPQA